MPDEVGDAAQGEEGDTDKGKAVAGGQALPPRRPAPPRAPGRDRQKDADGRQHRVENGVPGRKEGVVGSSVGVCPEVEVKPADQDRREDGHRPVEAGARLALDCQAPTVTSRSQVLRRETKRRTTVAITSHVNAGGTDEKSRGPAPMTAE